MLRVVVSVERRVERAEERVGGAWVVEEPAGCGGSQIAVPMMRSGVRELVSRATWSRPPCVRAQVSRRVRERWFRARENCGSVLDS